MALTPDFEDFKSKYLSTVNEILVSPEPAAMALIKMVSAQPGEITILALGPLTNLALAISMDDTFLDKVKSIVMMGGCLNARGNSNRVSEFNFNCDPEAVHIVMNAGSEFAARSPDSPPKLTVVTWETTLDYGLEWEFFDMLKEPSKSSPLGIFLGKYAAFYENMSRDLCERMEKKSDKERSLHDQYLMNALRFVMCDIYACVAALRPSAILHFKDWDVKIELSGSLSRGLMALDWFAADANANARVVLALDYDAVKMLLKETFCS
ncbi:hypothetical protein HDU76_004126 [Blyttiomyces sp. JEL0837]|nr:hypothetical protein HDU76_004126 [Blyttiomyces sp. JEL0837]